MFFFLKFKKKNRKSEHLSAWCSIDSPVLSSCDSKFYVIIVLIISRVGDKGFADGVVPKSCRRNDMISPKLFICFAFFFGFIVIISTAIEFAFAWAQAAAAVARAPVDLTCATD